MSDQVTVSRVATPIGTLLACVSPRGLVGLEYPHPTRRKRLAARVRRYFANAELVRGRGPLHAQIADWLGRYFSRDFPDPRDLTLDLRGTAFELAVWQALLEIRVGGTSTYQGLAARLGRPLGARAIGGAVGRNPASIVVPCHRVIGASGSLTGYGGGLDRKRWLLRHEGCEVEPQPTVLW